MARDNNFKTLFGEIPRRFEVRKNKTEGILNYDLDNAYPQRVKLLSDSSVTAKTCVNLFTKFIHGEGFKDKTVGETIVNGSGQNLNEILALVAADYSQYGGFALHFNFNALLDIDGITHIPFEYARLTTEDSDYPNKIALYNDWARQMSSKIMKDNIRYVDQYTPSRAATIEQIKDAEGFETWNGQVFYYSTHSHGYPLAPIDPALNDVETDAEISEFKKSNVLTSFLASHILMLKQAFETEEEADEYMAELMKFQGGKRAGKIFLMDNVTEENKPELIKVDVANNDLLFQYHETSAQDNIRKAFLAPKELVGMEYTTGFETDRIQQARAYYNSVTEFNRQEIEKQFAKFMRNFKATMSGNYQIQPLYSEPLGVEVEPTEPTE